MTDNPQNNSFNLQAAMDIRGLVQALKSDDKLIRRRAATALKGMNAIASLSALQKAHVAENDEETRTIMASAIDVLRKSTNMGVTGQLVDPDTATHPDSELTRAQILIKKIQSGDSEQMIAAAKEIGEEGEKLAVEALIIAFNNPKLSIHVRLAIAEALLKLESAPVEVALLANLRHTDWQIRRNGAAILGQLKAAWAVEPLSRSLKDPHPVVRRTALAALKYIGTPESRKALAQHVPSMGQTATTPKNTPKEVSGIEVKRPGHQNEQSEDDSPLLKRFQQERDFAARSRRDTQPFTEDSESAKRAAEIEKTQPIRDNILDDLEAALQDLEDKDTSDD